MLNFGIESRKTFMLDSNYINLNSGSYGCFPECVYKAKQGYVRKSLAKPDEFQQKQMEIINVARQKASEFVGVSHKQTTFAFNSSDAYNAVMKSFDYQQGDKLLLSNVSYKMNIQLIKYLEKRYQVQPIVVHFTRDSLQTNEGILKCYEDVLNKHKDIRIALIDHISSQPAIIFPLAKIVRLFRSLTEQTILYVDGAHVVGQINLDISQYDVDFYCTNFHKWAYSPRPVALLYMKECYLKTIQPNIIGSFADQGFHISFQWQGTQDMSNFMATSEAIDFINTQGQETIMKYCHNLVLEGARIVVQMWQTDLLISDEQFYGNMVMVRVPEGDLVKSNKIFKTMLFEHHIAIFEASFEGVSYARFSAQIFNCVDDFEKAAQLFLNIQRTMINSKIQQ